MKTRTLTVIFNAGVFLLLVALVLQAADIRRSLRRIEHEERELLHGHYTPHPFSPAEQAAYLVEAHKSPGLDELDKLADGPVIVDLIFLRVENNGEMVWHVGTCLAQDGHPGAKPSKAFEARIKAEFAKHSTKRVLVEPMPMARPL